VILRRNRLIYCSAGIYLDQSPFQPDLSNHFEENEIAFNGSGVQFHMPLDGNVFLRNRFIGNFVPVAVDNNGGAVMSQWSGNYWDTYEGFDRNGNGVGDTPYELYAYTGQLWLNKPGVKFFFASPVLTLLDFLEHLAPLRAPTLILRDEHPAFNRQPLPAQGTHPGREGIAHG
ncbi:MAG: nitrous oxide reductase family maturation protein NosD, partial [Magnetococcales bacterium]|nr:nitrous oxide reductase family maturation protein NosD [Magnetococcales bacterium]